jgi:hypothetical protein
MPTLDEYEDGPQLPDFCRFEPPLIVSNCQFNRAIMATDRLAPDGTAEWIACRILGFNGDGLHRVQTLGFVSFDVAVRFLKGEAVEYVPIPDDYLDSITIDEDEL